MKQFRDLNLYGIAPDLPQSKAGDHFTSARNMQAREAMERVRGLTPVLGSPLFEPEFLYQTRNALEAVIWVYAGAGGVGLVEGTSHSDVTPASWAPAGRRQEFTGGVLNSIPFINGALPYYWPGSGPFLGLPDWPATRSARAMRPYKFQLMALAINEGGTFLEDSVYWSSLAPPGQIPQEWTPSPDNQAGSAELGGTRGAVIDGAEIRDVFLVYKESSCYQMQYVGGSQKMVVRALSPTVGILNRNSIANVRGQQYILTLGDVLVTDGQQFASVADAKVRRAMFRNINETSIRQGFLMADAVRREVYVCIPDQGQPLASRAWVYSIDRDEWGQRDLPELAYYGEQGQFRFVEEAETWNTLGSATWNSQDDVTWRSLTVPQVDFDQLVVGVPGGFRALDLPTAAPDPNLPSALTRESLELVPGRLATVRRVWLEVDAPAGTRLNVTVIGREFLSENPPANTGTGEFIQGGVEKVDLQVTGRYFDIVIEADEGDDHIWRLVQSTIEYQPRGISR